MTPQTRNRLLRIGIIREGRIVNERLMIKRENITIGQWLLFEGTSQGYVARLADAMDARVVIGDDIVSLSELKETGLVKKQDQVWNMPLDEESYGKIMVGDDMTVVFQFVTPDSRDSPQF